MTVSTFDCFRAASWRAQDNTPGSWASQRNASQGASIWYTHVQPAFIGYYHVGSGSENSRWDRFYRSTFKFNCSAITDTDEIVSATFNFVCNNKVDTMTGASNGTARNIVLCKGWDDEDGTAINSTVGTEGFERNCIDSPTEAIASATMAISSVNDDDSTFNSIALNDEGLRTIMTDMGASDAENGTIFSMLIEADAKNDSPTPSQWGHSEASARVDVRSFTVTNKVPYLSVTHRAALIAQPLENQDQSFGSSTSYDDFGQTFTLAEETTITGFALKNKYNSGSGNTMAWGIEHTWNLNGTYTDPNRFVNDGDDSRLYVTGYKSMSVHLRGDTYTSGVARWERWTLSSPLTLEAGLFALRFSPDHNGDEDHDNRRQQYDGSTDVYTGGRAVWRPHGDDWGSASDAANHDRAFAIFYEPPAIATGKAVIIDSV